MAAKYGDNHNWVPWKFKRQRPDKVPGCQDTSWLPTLDEGQLSCEEGQECYYFSCGKCSPSLALDIMNSRYKTGLEYIPRIPNIESPDPFIKDNKYYQYEGEMFVYFKYFAQIEELTGVAFNGWSNLDAQRVFDGVTETFRGTKFYKTRDFEIDWILFNGSTITVIEVKANTEDSKSRKNFETKVKQLKKDQIVMQRLLEVTGCENVKVNYVIACPNVSIKEVTEGKLLNDHREFFQTITSARCGLGFISEECILQKSLYVYDTNEEKVVEEPFVDFVEQSGVLNGLSISNQTSTVWANTYKMAASSVVVSMLLFGNPVVHNESSALTAQDRSDPSEARSVAICMGTQKRKLPRVPGLPDELRKHFPENVLLGPEQLEVITCKSNKILIRGEPGTGKTSVLLALLFMHTAKVKHNLQPPKFKKVSFFLHESKTEFRKYVEAFIDRHCDKTYAKVMPLSTIQSLELAAEDDAKLMLFDECPIPDYSSRFWELIRNMPEVKLVSIITYSAAIYKSFPRNLDPEWEIFHLKNGYRCPANITLRYTKIRRQDIDHLSEERFLSFLNTAPHFIDENSIQILKYTEDIKECELPEQQFVGESLLVVIIDLNDTDFKKVDTMFADATDHCFTYRTISKCQIPLPIYSLNFTGVQYHTVVIIVGAQVRRDPDYPSQVDEILYHAVSRSLRRLIILCHELDYDWISGLLSLDNLDLSFFMKLSRGEQIPDQDISLLKTPEDLNGALEILIIRKEYTQLNRLLKYVFGSNLNQYLEEVIRRLGPRMVNLEEHDLLGLLESVLLPDGNFEFFGYFFIHSLGRSISKMRNIFLKLQPQYHVNWENFISQQLNRRISSTVLNLMTASVVLLDSKLFSLVLRVFKTAIHTITDIFLEISIEMPNRLKCHLQPYYKEYAWVSFDTEMQAWFSQYSILKENVPLDSINRSILTQMTAPASNLFKCSICSSLIALVIAQHDFPFSLETKEDLIGLILNAVKQEEEKFDGKTSIREALIYVKEELEKLKIEVESDDEVNI